MSTLSTANIRIHRKILISMVVSSIVFNESLGRYLADRMMLTHEGVGLSCEPDGMHVSNERFGNGLATLEQGDQSLEIIGGADMVLEVVSKTSVEKDTETLKDLYANAGVPEYWLVDSTVEVPELTILRLASGKYTTVRKQDGWVKSKVFGRSFRLNCKKDAKGLSSFNLETK